MHLTLQTGRFFFQNLKLDFLIHTRKNVSKIIKGTLTAKMEDFSFKISSFEFETLEKKIFTRHPLQIRKIFFFLKIFILFVQSHDTCSYFTFFSCVHEHGVLEHSSQCSERLYWFNLYQSVQFPNFFKEMIVSETQSKWHFCQFLKKFLFNN